MTGAATTTTTRERVLAAAARLLAADPSATLSQIAVAAGVSRATVHRIFDSRADLLAAVGAEPDPDARQRLLTAAAELLTRDGLAGLSMDELAERAGVSRASLYRLFPGKAALMEALVRRFSPFERLIAYVDSVGDRPPEEVIPEVYRLEATIALGNIGLLRQVLFEATSGRQEAVEGASRPVAAMLASLSRYLTAQMEAGRITRMHPTLAVEALIGPLFFYMQTSSVASRIVGLDVPTGEAVDQLGTFALRGLAAPATDGRIDDD